MRVKVLVSIVAVAVAGVGVGLHSPAGAGTNGLLQNTLTVVKVVEGPVPAGAVFEVEVDCEPLATSPASEGGSFTTLQFDENGDAIGPDSVDVGPFTECTATETVTNGAAVSYACQVAGPVVKSQPEGPPPPLPLAECTDDQSVTFYEVVEAEGTITVTNTFEEEPPPPPAVDDDDDVIGDVVTATPSFTG